MNAQLTINGQTISIELTQEQIEQLTKKKPAKRWEDLKEVSGWYIRASVINYQKNGSLASSTLVYYF